MTGPVLGGLELRQRADGRAADCRDPDGSAADRNRTAVHPIHGEGSSTPDVLKVHAFRSCRSRFLLVRFVTTDYMIARFAEGVFRGEDDDIFVEESNTPVTRRTARRCGPACYFFGCRHSLSRTLNSSLTQFFASAIEVEYEMVRPFRRKESSWIVFP